MLFADRIILLKLKLHYDFINVLPVCKHTTYSTCTEQLTGKNKYMFIINAFTIKRDETVIRMHSHTHAHTCTYTNTHGSTDRNINEDQQIKKEICHCGLNWCGVNNIHGTIKMTVGCKYSSNKQRENAICFYCSTKVHKEQDCD